MASPLTLKDPSQKPKGEEPHYTVFIRLPFRRGNFMDPPPVNWDSKKDRALWDVISEASSGKEIDWHFLADTYDVSLTFLLQQAAFLYERQLSQVRAQLRKVNRPVSMGTPPLPSSASGSTHAMTRGDSHGSRVPSALSTRAREQNIPQSQAVSPEVAPQIRDHRMSRNSSTNTIMKVQKSSLFVREPSHADLSTISTQAGQVSDASPRLRTPSPRRDDSTSSSSSESEDQAPLSRSKAYARRSRFSVSTVKAPLGPLSDADEDSEDSPPFLPFSDKNATKKVDSRSADPGATVKRSPKFQKARLATPSTLSKPQSSPAAGTNASSSSSAQSQPLSRENPSSRAPLSSLSPRQRRMAKEGSDGTPSMGSSFSDLDDTSVTQSALEEALANESGVASRMSTISQALRSRYL